MLLAFYRCSMMLLDGRQRNIIQMINNPLSSWSKIVEMFLLKKMVQLRSLALFGMKHLVITLMLLLDSTMMEIQVCLLLNCILWYLSEKEIYFVFVVAAKNADSMSNTHYCFCLWPFWNIHLQKKISVLKLVFDSFDIAICRSLLWW